MPPPTEVFQSDLEGYKSGTNVVLEASSWIGVAGTFSGASVALTPDSNLTLRTRNAPIDSSFTSGIKLSDSNLGANLEFRTQGTGSITLQTGFTGSGAQNANISVGKLTTAGGAISLTAQGSGSDVIVLGNLDAGTGANTLKADGNVRFDGSNPMTLTGSSLSVSGGSGVLVNTSLTNHSGLWVNPAGSLLSINGSLTMGSGSSLNNAGTLDTATHSVVDTANQNLVNQRSGTLKGTGTLNVGSGTVINEGTVAPGHSPGMLAITGNFTQTSTGTLNMEVAGPGNHDLVQVSGTATLGGSLAMQSGTYTPTTTESYNLVRASALTGTFANITSHRFQPWRSLLFDNPGRVYSKCWPLLLHQPQHRPSPKSLRWGTRHRRYHYDRRRKYHRHGCRKHGQHKHLINNRHLNCINTSLRRLGVIPDH
ncbi:MAG: hypothetical protein IPJ18_17720 [Betaproteobacteria bacterium]|nr:hypothetical protein [Betaproteobacteria bacterium]